MVTLIFKQAAEGMIPDTSTLEIFLSQLNVEWSLLRLN